MKFLLASAIVLGGIALITLGCLLAGKVGLQNPFPAVIAWAACWVSGIVLVDHGLRQW